MTHLKRTLLGAGLAAMCLTVAAAPSYPERPITLINPYAAGGPADVLGRALAHELEAELGKPVVVENKAGGGASIGAAYVARAQPDGYTLLLGTSAAHVVTPLMQKVSYDGIKDFTFVAIVGNQPNMLVVNPQVKAANVQELIALAQKSPGDLNYASAGPGSSPHLGGALFGQRAGIDIVHIPYAGAAPAITDVVGGQVDMALLNLSASLPFIQEGRLKPLAYAADKRSPLLPDVPTLAEVGIKDAESASWYSLAAPVGTPDAVVQALNQAVTRINHKAEYRQAMEAKGVQLWDMTPQQAADFVRRDRQTMSELVKAAGLAAK